ncbi:MAG TPA: hypothetical protein V6C95_18895 [Coleofasciculaceae cyanobacterium]
MPISIQFLVLLTTTFYHIIATRMENKAYPPPGRRIDTAIQEMLRELNCDHV